MAARIGRSHSHGISFRRGKVVYEVIDRSVRSVFSERFVEELCFTQRAGEIRREPWRKGRVYHCGDRDSVNEVGEAGTEFPCPSERLKEKLAGWAGYVIYAAHPVVRAT